MTLPGGRGVSGGGPAGGDDRAATTSENATAENAADSAALTCIRDAYTLASHDSNATEIDDLMVKQFLATLSEVAMAVASRMRTA